jgi:hypothetical protein
MPPKKSRRLPGGKVRRPEARPARPAALAAPEIVDEEGEENEEELELSDTAVTLEDYRVARPAPEPAPLSSASRRLRERRARAQVGRTGPSHMDLAAQNYGHVRGDLIRIAIIAAIMFGVIVALSFVIR